MKLSAAQERVLSRMTGNDALIYMSPPNPRFYWQSDGSGVHPDTVHGLWKLRLIDSINDSTKDSASATYFLTDEGRALAKKLREEG